MRSHNGVHEIYPTLTTTTTRATFSTNASQTRFHCRQGPGLYRLQGARQARRGCQGCQKDLKGRRARRGRKEEAKEAAKGDVLVLHLQGSVPHLGLCH